MAPPLPATLDDLVTQLQDLDACAICTELYAYPDHLATQIPQCGHILGKPCLLEWFQSKHENANTCPVCRTKLWNRAASDDDLDEDENMVSQLAFLQTLWGTLYNILNGYPVEDDGLLPDDLIEQIIDSSDQQTADWSMRSRFLSPEQTAQLMYHLMGFGQGTPYGSSSLPFKTLNVWYNVTLSSAVPLSWVELAVGIDEVCREQFSASEYENLAGGNVLRWFTMHLIQDMSTNGHDARIWPLKASDEEVKHRVLAIGALMMDYVPSRALSHTIKVARLLYRFHYPGLPPAHRDCGLLDHDDLI